jgi:hypothetical protein
MTRRVFTCEYAGIVNALLTDSEVSLPYDPSVDGVVHPAIERVRALWDTGATHSMISSSLASRLCLVRKGIADTLHAQGSTESSIYKLNIILPNGVEFYYWDVVEGQLSGFEVLLGMDIISKGDFAITSNGYRTKFSFQMPSTHDIDFRAG